MINQKLIGLFEITLIVLSSFAFAHAISETNSLIESLPVDSKESKIIKFIREKTLNYLSGGLVSAQTSLQTCLVNLNGTSCQEYPASTCDSQCTTSGGCFPGRRINYADCQLGTCYDSNLGLCNGGTPRGSCELQGGVWSIETPVQCNRGCCLIGPDGNGGADQARLSTSQECNFLGRNGGAPTTWEPQTTSEISCIMKATTRNEGACVLDLDEGIGKYNCKLETGVSCLNLGGTFYEGKLCTHPELNTKCERTTDTQCFRDRVYFVDDCENRANIYDNNKLNDATYWSNIVSTEQSCTLGTSSNGLANQQRCGNCNYLGGSVCGLPQTGVDNQPNAGQYVCKDLACMDNGVRRDHGESWCVFEGWTGLDGEEGSNAERATDVVGSRHYRKLCSEGEIRIEPLAEYRNGVCVESEIRPGFTTANPRTNMGALCTQYNKDAESLAKCEESPDCFLKHVEIDKFKFDVCVSKYPPGLELSDEPQADSQSICAAATQTCTYYEKKSLDGRWSCKINCGCKNAEFAETMNNLCMSLGDCGTKSNLAGEIGKGHAVTGDRIPKISQSYIDGLKRYASQKDGQRVDGLTNEQIATALGFDPSGLTSDELASKISQFGLGAAGILGYQLGNAVIYWDATTNTALQFPSFSGWGGAFNSALVGAGIGYIVGLAFGLEGDDLIVAMVVGAAVIAATNALWGYLAISTSLGPVGWIAAIIIAVIIAIISIAGVGKYRERKVNFECLPWQAPSGGDNCDRCTELGVECTTYKCKSLGKTCELINPQTENVACIDSNPNDSIAPIITFNSTALSDGFSYEERQDGVIIKDNSSMDGSIKEYSAVKFGIVLNEHATCKLSSVRGESYEDMEDSFFESSANTYTLRHEESTAMETLSNLGVGGIGPDRRGDYNLYARCEDKKGNPTDSAYTIRFRVAPANDAMRPVIDKFVPESPGVTGLNSTSFNLIFYTDEPATCRFSDTDQIYETMQGETHCENELSQSVIYEQGVGWLCRATLPVSQDTNNYYLRCADQPWLGTTIEESSSVIEEGRNVATESRNYVVRKTTTALTIASITPNNRTIRSGTEPVSVTLDVVTRGGIDNGKAFCKYSLNSGRYIDFRDTSLSSHRQTWDSLFAGSYSIELKCEDRAGNIANGNTQFTIEVDNDGPIITRVYNSGNSLRVITNEASTCAYSTSSCSFDFASGILLSGLANSHTMPYNNGLTYSVKCRDTFGNMGSCLSVSGGY